MSIARQLAGGQFMKDRACAVNTTSAITAVYCDAACHHTCTRLPPARALPCGAKHCLPCRAAIPFSNAHVNNARRLRLRFTVLAYLSR